MYFFCLYLAPAGNSFWKRKQFGGGKRSSLKQLFTGVLDTAGLNCEDCRECSIFCLLLTLNQSTVATDDSFLGVDQGGEGK